MSFRRGQFSAENISLENGYFLFSVFIFISVINTFLTRCVWKDDK
jgi:hypothetical protein